MRSSESGKAVLIGSDQGLILEIFC